MGCIWVCGTPINRESWNLQLLVPVFQRMNGSIGLIGKQKRDRLPQVLKNRRQIVVMLMFGRRAKILPR